MLVISIFGFNASAQTDDGKPLDKSQLTALVKELKGVVSRTELDKKKSAAVADKWDKRTDFAGKTRMQVIDLLYEDVKSVVKNSGTQYEIYSIFSFYRTIPDSPITDESTAKTVPVSKPELVKNLLELTLEFHPSNGASEQIALMPKTADAKETEAEMKKSRIELFDIFLKQNKTFTTKEKEFIQANYEKLEKIVDKQTTDSAPSNYKTEQWVKESLVQLYGKKFTVIELNKLIMFFKSANGMSTLKFIRYSEFSATFVDEKRLYSKEDKIEHNKFMKTLLGKKFFKTFIKDSNIYLEPKMKEAYDNYMDKIFSILDEVNINKMFNKFVAENYKK